MKDIFGFLAGIFMFITVFLWLTDGKVSMQKGNIKTTYELLDSTGIIIKITYDTLTIKELTIE